MDFSVYCGISIMAFYFISSRIPINIRATLYGSVLLLWQSYYFWSYNGLLISQHLYLSHSIFLYLGVLDMIVVESLFILAR